MWRLEFMAWGMSVTVPDEFRPLLPGYKNAREHNQTHEPVQERVHNGLLRQPFIHWNHMKSPVSTKEPALSERMSFWSGDQLATAMTLPQRAPGRW